MGLIDMGLIFQVFTSLWIGRWRCRWNRWNGEGPSGKIGPGPKRHFMFFFFARRKNGAVSGEPSGIPVETGDFFVGKRYLLELSPMTMLVFLVLVCLAIGYDFPYSQHSGKFHLRSSLGHGWHYLPLGSECFSPIGTKSTSVSPAFSFGCPLFWEQKKQKNTASEAWNQLGIRHVGM